MTAYVDDILEHRAKEAKVKEDKERDAKVKEIERAVKAGIDYQKKKLMLSKSKKTHSQRSNSRSKNVQLVKIKKKVGFKEIFRNNNKLGAIYK